MRIVLQRFRSYIDERGFDIHSAISSKGSISLIAGTSGAGKSTILEACLWTLYGQMQHVYPTGQPGTSTKPTIVTLTFPELGGLIVRRSKPPEVVECVIPVPTGAARTLTGSEAQAYIIATFGSRDLWVASSYISQGERSPLVTLTSREKFELLKELTFGLDSQIATETPDYYIERLDGELIKVSQLVHEMTTAYNLLRGQFESALQIYRDDFETWGTRPGTAEALIELRGQCAQQETAINTQRLSYQQARDAETAYHEAQAMRAKLEAQLTALLSQLVSPEQEMGWLTEIKALRMQDELAQAHRSIQQHLNSVRKSRDELRVKPEHLRGNRDELKAKLAQDLGRRDAFVKLGVTPNTRDAEVTRIDEQLVNEEQKIVTYAKWEARTRELTTQIAEITAKYEADYAMRLERHRLDERQREQIITANQLLERQYILALAERDRLKQLHITHERTRCTIAELRKHETQITTERDAAQTMITQLRATLTSVVDPRTRLAELKLLEAELVCPHCHNGVTFHDGALHKGSTTNRDTLAVEQKQCQQWLAQLTIVADHERMLTQIRDRITQLTSTLPERELPAIPEVTAPTYAPVPPAIPPSPYRQSLQLPAIPSEPPKPIDTTILKQRREELRRLAKPDRTDVELDQDHTSLANIDRYLEYTRIIDEQTARLGSHRDAPVDLTARLAELDAKITAQRQLSGRVAELKHQIADYAKHVKPTVVAAEIASALSKLEQDYRQMVTIIQAGERVVAITVARADLEMRQQHLQQYTNYQAQLTRLKTVITEAASQAMEDIVTTINNDTNTILDALFDDDIRVILATTRTLKTKDRTKLEVNLQIIYHGQTYTSPKELSGGEQDRVSLALTLALARLNTSPILLLDECIASLDGGLRDRCLKAIRHHLPDKTVIHVCHEVVEGYHDHVVHLTTPEATT